jgi:hypothetical protein
MGFLSRSQRPTPPVQEGALRWRMLDLRTWVRSSPWLAIAVLIHVLLVAVLSVVYMASGRPKAEARTTSITLADRRSEPPAPIEEPPPIIDRTLVPVLLDAREGPVNPDPIYELSADAGRPGEITDETDWEKDPGIFNEDSEALSTLPSGATGGTPIGMGSLGHHGSGKPSAFVSRRAGQGGPGGGGAGQGGGGGPGGSTQDTEAAVLAALVWLKNHQSPGGMWDADGFSANCKRNACGGPGNALNDLGVTGLALLCYLGAGYTHEDGAFKDTVKSGLKYLIDMQDEDGCFGDRVGQHFLYNHACAALAMAEAYGRTEAKAFKEPAQGGIQFVLTAQNPYSAWRYAVPPDGDNDTSVTGWMIMVLKSGAMSGLRIDTAALDNALSFIDEVTDPVTGRSGYTQAGQRPSRMPSLMDRFPAESSESLTAVGMVARIFAGRTLESDPMISKGADLLVNRLPVWDPDAGANDFYYWYYATLAMFQVGGARWEKWNQALKGSLLDKQRLDPEEDEYGSWDPLDPWAVEGGRIYSTALNCLSMEVYYRYPRVFGAHGGKGEKKE